MKASSRIRRPVSKRERHLLNVIRVKGVPKGGEVEGRHKISGSLSGSVRKKDRQELGYIFAELLAIFEILEIARLYFLQSDLDWTGG